MANININENDTRIKKLADYLLPIVNNLISRNAQLINANMLSKNINNFSLDKIPTATVIEEDIVGNQIKKDVYSFRSRNEYSTDQINNLKNIGFFEKFENIIKCKNDNGDLPNIDGIISITCLNSGTVNNINTNTCDMNIQLQIEYEIKGGTICQV